MILSNLEKRILSLNSCNKQHKFTVGADSFFLMLLLFTSNHHIQYFCSNLGYCIRIMTRGGIYYEI